MEHHAISADVACAADVVMGSAQKVSHQWTEARAAGGAVFNKPAIPLTDQLDSAG